MGLGVTRKFKNVIPEMKKMTVEEDVVETIEQCNIKVTKHITITDSECDNALMELQGLRDELRLMSNRMIDIKARIKHIEGMIHE